MNLSNALTNFFTYFSNSITSPTSNRNPMEEKPSSLAIDFPDANDKMMTEPFLEACSGLLDLLENLGKAFQPIVHDLRKCIGVLTEMHEEDPVAHKHLLDVVLVERAEGGTKATDSLLWIRRSMTYIGYFFSLILEDSVSGRCNRDLGVFLRKAYAEVLEPHQAWLGYQMNQILSKMTPRRSEFFSILAGSQLPVDEKSLVEALRYYNRRMVACAQHLERFYTESGFDSIV